MREVLFIGHFLWQPGYLTEKEGAFPWVHGWNSQSTFSVIAIEKGIRPFGDCSPQYC